MNRDEVRLDQRSEMIMVISLMEIRDCRGSSGKYKYDENVRESPRSLEPLWPAESAFSRLYFELAVRKTLAAARRQPRLTLPASRARL